MIYINKFNTSKNLIKLFGNLPVDKYTPGDFRFRRFSKFDYIDNTATIRSSETFSQGGDINDFLGDVVRTYPEIEKDALYDPSFLRALDIYSEATGITEDIGVHMIRIYVKEGAAPAPEGNHQDGFDKIAIFFTNRVNVNGGHMLAFDNKEGEPFLNKMLINQFALIDDKEYFHNGSPLSKVDKSKEGYWDVMVLTGNQKVQK